MVSGEVQALHTRILRLTLAVQESRTYWAHVDPQLKGTPRIERAFTERWFGSKSLARVKLLLAHFAHRFDAFPEALDTLRSWQPQDVGTRPLICHWHLQLSDPLYRAFTGDWLFARREEGRREFDRDAVARWLTSLPGAEWAPSTRFQFATKLIRAADEAGLVSGASNGPRTILAPRIPDEALGYLVRRLQQIPHSGTWRDNAYFRSVGLWEESLESRLGRLPQVQYRRMGDLVELETRPLGELQ